MLFLVSKVCNYLHHVPSVLSSVGPRREARDGDSVSGAVQGPHQGTAAGQISAQW